MWWNTWQDFFLPSKNRVICGTLKLGNSMISVFFFHRFFVINNCVFLLQKYNFLDAESFTGVPPGAKRQVHNPLRGPSQARKLRYTILCGVSPTALRLRRTDASTRSWGRTRLSDAGCAWVGVAVVDARSARFILNSLFKPTEGDGTQESLD